MLYKLSFTKTADGLLRVSASVGRTSEHVIAIYQSDLAFLHLLKHADLNQEVIDKLERAVEIGLAIRNCLFESYLIFHEGSFGVASSSSNLSKRIASRFFR